MELAKRLNKELQGNNMTAQGKPETPSNRQKSQGSPEPRARSLDQQKESTGKFKGILIQNYFKSYIIAYQKIRVYQIWQ